MNKMPEKKKEKQVSLPIDKYEGLDISPAFAEVATETPELLDALCNGVGSVIGWAKWFYPLIPNTIWGLDITPASDIHDIDYVLPKRFPDKKTAIKHKKKADKRFYNNVNFLIRKNTKMKWLKKFRLSRSRKYYFVLKNLGDESFLKDKTIGEQINK
jgi:hypothetical protein